MKYENFKEVKQLVETIDKYNSIIEGLNNDFVEIMVSNNYSKIMTIGAWESCEHSAKKSAINFKDELLYHYKLKLQGFHEKLLTL